MECLSEYLKEIFTGFVLVILSGVVIYYFTQAKPNKKKNIWVGIDDLKEKIENKYKNTPGYKQTLQYMNQDIQKKISKMPIGEKLEDYFGKIYGTHHEAEIVGRALINELETIKK